FTLSTSAIRNQVSLFFFNQEIVWSPLNNNKKPRTEFFPRLDHYPKYSFHKDILFPVSKDAGDQGDEFTGGGSSRYAHETDAESSCLLDEMGEGGSGYLVGYKCRQGVSLDRGRLRRFNHDPSYTTSVLVVRIPNRPFVHGSACRREEYEDKSLDFYRNRVTSTWGPPLRAGYEKRQRLFIPNLVPAVSRSFDLQPWRQREPYGVSTNYSREK
ncbi:unnamed protein product, partial [Heterotrigona itama]